MTFENVAGLKEEKEELEELVDFCVHQRSIQTLVHVFRKVCS